MPGENLRVWNQQTKFTYNHWLAALGKGKCSSTKPTRLATGVVCHLDSEQDRPYKIPPALPGFEPETYCTASENFTSVPHYSLISSSVAHTICELYIKEEVVCYFYASSI